MQISFNFVILLFVIWTRNNERRRDKAIHKHSHVAGNAYFFLIFIWLLAAFLSSENLNSKILTGIKDFRNYGVEIESKMLILCNSFAYYIEYETIEPRWTMDISLLLLALILATLLVIGIVHIILMAYYFRRWTCFFRRWNQDLQWSSKNL
jgi:hypothetical protein